LVFACPSFLPPAPAGRLPPISSVDTQDALSFTKAPHLRRVAELVVHTEVAPGPAPLRVSWGEYSRTITDSSRLAKHLTKANERRRQTTHPAKTPANVVRRPNGRCGKWAFRTAAKRPFAPDKPVPISTQRRAKSRELTWTCKTRFCPAIVGGSVVIERQVSAVDTP
jgi:hypothetical protein